MIPSSHSLSQSQQPLTIGRADQQKSIWIVIAAYNEGGRLSNTLKAIASEGSVVVVDDGSRDNTSEVASTFPVWVLQHPINCGQGAALQTGIDFALSRGAEAIVTFDADGQHDPADLTRMLQPVLNGEVDVVLGSRFLGTTQNMPWSRRVLLKLAILFTRLTNGLKLTDTHNGFRVLSRKAAQQIVACVLRFPQNPAGATIDDTRSAILETYDRKPIAGR